MKILIFHTHGSFEKNFYQLSHDFFVLPLKGKEIDREKFFRNLAKNSYQNVTFIELEDLEALSFDAIITQSRAHHNGALEMQKTFKCPIIQIEHTTPLNVFSPSLHVAPALLKEKLKRSLGRQNLRPAELAQESEQVKIKVFITDFQRRAWADFNPRSRVILHGIDGNIFFPPPAGQSRKNSIVSAVNEFAQRDFHCGWKLWQASVKGLPHELIGENPDTRDIQAREPLREEFAKVKIFLNTSLVSPCPLSLLEAMACGCAVVSTDTCGIPEYIKHGEDGLLAQNPEQLRFYLELLLKDDALAARLGAAAAKKIQTHFSLPRFLQDWTEVLSSL